MSDMTPEQRLMLVQQLRQRNCEDRLDMNHCESLLYDDAPVYSGERHGYTGIRVLAAVLMVALVVFLDKSQTKIAGITSTGFFEMISADNNNTAERILTFLVKDYNSPQR